MANRRRSLRLPKVETTVPLVGVSGVAVGGQVTIRIEDTEESRERGQQTVEEIREAVRLPTHEKRVRRLAVLVRVCGEMILTVAEGREFINRLIRNGEWRAVAVILGSARARGRPDENHLFAVAVIERTAQAEGISIPKAVSVVRARYPEMFGHKSARSLYDEYTRWKEKYAVLCGSRSIDPSSF